jgi:biopolymer transport protein ExbB/TolQ
MDTNVVATATEQLAQTTPQNTVGTLEYMATFMNEGGMFMWVILAIWILGLAIAFERIKKLRDFDVNSVDLMANVKKNVLLNKVEDAIQMCSNTSSVVANMLKAALQRSNQSKEQKRKQKQRQKARNDSSKSKKKPFSGIFQKD